jgi:protein SCO1/2
MNSPHPLSRRSLLLGGLSACWAPALVGCKSSGEPLPKLTQVPGFSLVNQAGKPFTQTSLEGSVWIAAFLFTRCPTVCPRIMKRLVQMQATAKNKSIGVKFLCFSVDPEFDTPKVLTAFGERYGADFSRWVFLTGDSSVVQKTVVDGFKIGLEGAIDESKDHLGITHGSHLALVDQARFVRGYYRSSEEPKTREMLLHASRLSAGDA